MSETNQATHVFELRHPFEHRGANYTRFEARRPKVRDLNEFMRAVEKDPNSAMTKIISTLLQVDTQIIEQIDLEDFAPMKKWFEDFLKPMMPDSNA